MQRFFSIVFFCFAALLCSCNLNSRLDHVSLLSIQEEEVFARDVMFAVRYAANVNDGSILVNAKESDRLVREIEKAAVKRLQSSGYAVSYRLPEQERQSGDQSSSYDSAAYAHTVDLDYVFYTGSNYVELVIAIDQIRFSRLYDNRNRNPKAVSNFIRGSITQ